MPEITINTPPLAETPDEAYELECLFNYRAAFSGPAGEFVLKDLINLCLVSESVFTQADYDPVKAAFFEGRRSVALRLLRFSGREPYQR